jgi:P4 family phage/plasmid primase-like protien
LYQILKDYLNSNFEAYIREWFPNAYRINYTTWKTGDFNDSKPRNKNDGSLVFNMRDKYAKDFSTGETAGDIISIYAKRYCHGDNKQAFTELVERYNLQDIFPAKNAKDTKNNSYSTNEYNQNTYDNTYAAATEDDTANQPKPNVHKTKPTKETIEKDNKIKNILSKIQDYKAGDPVDLYLKARGITKYSHETKIVNGDKMDIMVNIIKDHKNNSSVVGIHEIFLTKDGKKRQTDNFPSKIQRAFTNKSISGNPVKLQAKGSNNGFIYVTEGIENGLSLQEHINNEVWCSLSIVNIPTLPFDDNKVYIIVFDNDLNKEAGRHNLEQTLEKLSKLKNKHFLYLLPSEEGKDANDLLKENKLKHLLLHKTPVPIQTKNSVRTSNGKSREGFSPYKPNEINEIYNNNDNAFPPSLFNFINIPYDNKGIAKRFLARYGDKYKNIINVGFFKYNDGVYKDHCDNHLFHDIEQTLVLTWYEFNYLTDKEQIKSFKQLWKTRGIGEYSTIIAIERYIRKMFELEADAKDFDNENDNIINMNNGYFDLDKIEFKPHTPSKLFTKKVEVDYKDSLNLGYMNSDWLKFLNQVFNNDQEKIRYAQKAIGYTFSTSIEEEKVFIIKGVPRSGKNTFLETIGTIMADYSDTEDEDFIVSRDKNSNYLLDARAQLKGKRFLHISELSAKSRINSNLIKRLAGDKYMTGAEKFKGKITYKQQVKYWIATNNLDFDNFDDSVRTKLAIIEFNNRFYPEGSKESKETGRVIDKSLKDRLLEPHNRQFILKWIIEGYKLYKKEGLTPTEEMENILNQVERDNDGIKTFFNENMKQFNEENQTVYEQKDINEIYQIYSAFEQQEYGTPPERIVTLRKFFKILRNRGFTIERKYLNKFGKKNYYILGWCLLEDRVVDKYNSVD